MDFTQKQVYSLIRDMTGQANILTIPRLFIDLTGADHKAALLLSQLVYWSERTKDPDGWVHKSYKEWYQELVLTQAEVMRIIKKLAPFGVETILRKVGTAPKLHYRINQRLFTNSIMNFVDNQKSSLSENSINMDYEESSLSDYEESSLSTYTEITDPEITQRPLLGQDAIAPALLFPEPPQQATLGLAVENPCPDKPELYGPRPANVTRKEWYNRVLALIEQGCGPVEPDSSTKNGTRRVSAQRVLTDLIWEVFGLVGKPDIATIKRVGKLGKEIGNAWLTRDFILANSKHQPDGDVVNYLTKTWNKQKEAEANPPPRFSRNGTQNQPAPANKVIAGYEIKPHEQETLLNPKWISGRLAVLTRLSNETREPSYLAKYAEESEKLNKILAALESAQK
jgi:hypothetical protein